MSYKTVFWKLFLFIIILINSLSCYKKESSKAEIEEIEINFRKNEKDFNKLIKWIQAYNYEDEYPYTLFVDRLDGAVIDPEYAPWINIFDKEENSFIKNFIIKNNLSYVIVYEDVIWFYVRETNINLDLYRIGYFRTKKRERIKDYKIVTSKELPIEETGWVYKIKENWYLENRFPKKDISDSLRKVEKYNSDYLKQFNHSFKGTIIENKTKKKQQRTSDRLAMMKIKLQESSINYYDPRDSLKYYFCLIDFPYAEAIYKEGFLQFTIGDTCIFNHHEFIKDKLCLSRNGGESFECTNPDIVNNNIDSIKILFSIPLYTKLEKEIKIESNHYSRNKSDHIYRFYLGKYHTKSEFQKLKKKYEKFFLINECTDDNAYVKVKKGNTTFLFYRLSFYNLKHIGKYHEKIDNRNLMVGVFNKNDEFLKIYKRVLR